MEKVLENHKKTFKFVKYLYKKDKIVILWVVI